MGGWSGQPQILKSPYPEFSSLLFKTQSKACFSNSIAAIHCFRMYNQHFTPLHSIIINLIPRLLYLLLLGGGASLMAAMLTKEVQHNLQSAFKGDDHSVGGGDGVDGGGGGISCKSSFP